MAISGLAQRKSVRGMNHLMLFCGILSGLCNSVGAIEMINLNCQTSQDCWYTFSPVIQIITPWIMLLALYFQFIHYIFRNPDDRETPNQETPNRETPYQETPYHLTLERMDIETDAPTVRMSRIPVSIFCLIIIILSVTLSAVLVDHLSDHRRLYGVILNISGGILSCLMWIPQIYTSIREHGAQSLSIWTIGLHSIGCFLTVIYQATMTEQPLWNIITFVVSGTLELIIWGICLSWLIQQKRDRYHRI